MRSVLNNSIARRCGWFALCLLPWLVVLAVPLWRSILIAELPRLSEDGLHQMPNFKGGSTPTGWWMDSGLDGRQPADLNSQVVLHQYSPDLSILETFLRDSCQRYPKQNWLLATLLSVQVYRLQDSYMTYFFPCSRIIPAEQVQKAFASARRGCQREPHNAYYPWMLATIYLFNHQNKQALQSLRQAKSLPYFDNHWRELTRAWFDCQSFKHYGRKNLVEDVIWSPIRSQADEGWKQFGEFTEVRKNCLNDCSDVIPCLNIVSNLMSLARMRSESEPGCYWICDSLIANGNDVQSSYPDQIGTIGVFRSAAYYNDYNYSVQNALSLFEEDRINEIYRPPFDNAPPPRIEMKAKLVVQQCMKWPENSMRALLPSEVSSTLWTIRWAEKAVLLESGISLLMVLTLFLIAVPWGMQDFSIRRYDLLISTLIMTGGALNFILTYGREAPNTFIGPGCSWNGGVQAFLIRSNCLQGIAIMTFGVMIATWTRQNQNHLEIKSWLISRLKQIRRMFGPSSVPFWFRAVAWALLFGALQFPLLWMAAIRFNRYGRYGEFFSQFSMNSESPLITCLLLLLPYVLWHLIYWRWMVPLQHRAAAHYALKWFRWTLITSIGISGLLYLALLVASIPYREAAKKQWNEALQPYHYQTVAPNAPPLPIQ